MLNVECKQCGKHFNSKRNTAKFCSAACRVAYHRAKKQTTELPFNAAMEHIITLGRAVERAELSYEAIVLLRNLRRTIDFYDTANSSSWWRCRRCWTAVRKSLPDESDCQCGKKAQWELQKTLF